MKLEFEVRDTRNMLEELEEHLDNNPGFTGTIELFGDMVSKSVDRYYAIGYCRDGKFHREDGHAIYMNYKDMQYIADAMDGVVSSSRCYNLFDDYEPTVWLDSQKGAQAVSQDNSDIDQAESDISKLFDDL